jgi:hypothetical protein
VTAIQVRDVVTRLIAAGHWREGIRASWPSSTPATTSRAWRHTFRLFKQVLGWTTPKIRDPAAADRWTWLIIAAMPSSASPARWPLTCAAPGNAQPSRAADPGPGPPRVPDIRAKAAQPTGAPKPGKPVPRRPDRRTAAPHPATTSANHQTRTHAQ